MTAPARVKWRSAIVDSELSTVVKMVAVSLAEFVNNETGMAWPGLPALAAKSSCNERSVRRALDALVVAGWITLVTQGGMKGQKKTASVWKITTPDRVSTVTLDTESTIDGSTLDTESAAPWTHSPTTLDTESTQPVIEPETDEPEECVGLVPRDTYEVDPFEPARPTVFQMARNQVNLHPEEVDQYIEDAISLHGVRRVTDVVAALAEATSPNTYARQFDKKLTRALNAYQIQRVVLDRDDPFVPANTPAPIDRPTGNAHAGCTTCNGSTWVTPTDENGDATGEPVYRCPERHLKAVGA